MINWKLPIETKKRHKATYLLTLDNPRSTGFRHVVRIEDKTGAESIAVCDDNGFQRSPNRVVLRNKISPPALAAPPVDSLRGE